MVSKCPVCNGNGTPFAVYRFDLVTIYWTCHNPGCENPMWIENGSLFRDVNAADKKSREMAEKKGTVNP